MKTNNYGNAGSLIVADHAGMASYTRAKVVVCRQILRLSYGVLAETFGLVGKAQLDAVRFAMIEDLGQFPGPVYSWRECAHRVMGAAEHGVLH